LRIGWLVNGSYVVCETCWPPQLLKEVYGHISPIYLENIQPYSQPCGFCGRELNPHNPADTVLFDEKPKLLVEGRKWDDSLVALLRERPSSYFQILEVDEPT
jgi:hypothetical protein